MAGLQDPAASKASLAELKDDGPWKAPDGANFRVPQGVVATEVSRGELELVDQHGVAKGTPAGSDQTLRRGFVCKKVRAGRTVTWCGHPTPVPPPAGGCRQHQDLIMAGLVSTSVPCSTAPGFTWH